MELLKVSSNSNPSSVAGAVVAMLKDNKKVALQAVGAGAVNQAVKAIAISRGFVAPLGMDLVCIPAFSEIELENEEKTCMKFIIKENN